MPPNASQFPWSTVEKVAANLLTSGLHSGISFAYDSLNSRVNATATGGSGGGSINLTNLSVSSQSASGSGSLSFNDQTGVFAFTPPNLSTYTIRNAAESFASLLVNTSVSSSTTLTDSISSLTGVNPVAFPNGITPSTLITTGPGGSAGSAGQYLTSTGNGLSWVTLSAITENTSATLANLVVTGNLNVIGTTTTTNLTTLNVTNSQIVLNDSVVGAPSSNADIIVNRGTLTDTAIRWNELTDRWEFTNDGITYVNLPTPTEYNNYNNLINRPTIPAAQVNSDWSATGGVTAILNKPTLFSGNYTDLTNTPTIPTLLRNFSDVSDATPTIGNILRWDGTQWAPASAAGSGGGGGTMIGPVVSTDKAITRFNGSTGLEVQNSLVIIADDGSITAPRVKNLIPFYHSTLAEFSTASGNEGAIAYSESGGALYYSHNSSWTNQRIVTTTSSTSSDLQVLIGNFQKTYSTSAQDVTINNVNQSDRKALRLSDSTGITSDIIIKVSSGLNISRSTNELTLSGRTYNFTTELATGNQIKVRLQEIGIATVNTDITFAGADGLLIERTNPTTITFRAPPTVVTQYTDSLAKDAAALMLINGSKVGITYTYDSVNKVLNSVVSGGGSGGSGTVITYDLTGRNTNSNNAIIDLIPSSGLTDTIEFAGSAGTSVNWDAGNKRITIGSVAPVQADWNQTNASSLNFIQNKPAIPTQYTLPTASSSVIGGVRIGSNLSIDVNGILSANAGSYTLPVATAGTLGGIKIGSGLSIDGNGVVSSSGGNALLPSIQNVSGTTASLAVDAYAELNIVGHETYTIYKITASKESWIRIYTDDVSRDADITRSEGQDPLSGSGIITEIRTINDNDTVLITPGVLGFNNDNPRTNIIYLSVTNRSVSPTPITVTLTILGGSGITNTGESGGSGITDIVLDLTPQLGGNLDLNSKNITGTGNINVDGDITGKGLKLSYNNPTSLSTPGTSGEIRKIDGAPFWYDGVEWREFFLINATAVTQVADTDWDKTILRCDFENDANDLRFGETATLLGSAAVSSAQYKFGTKSLRINSTDSYIAFTPGVTRPEYNFEGEWTIEGWYYFNALNYPAQDQNNGLSTLFSIVNPNNGSSNIIALYFQLTNELLGASYYMRQKIIYASNGVTKDYWVAASNSPSRILENTWNHIAVQRNSTGLISIIVNGYRQGSYIENGIVNISNEYILIGQGFYSSATYPGGFIDDFRISTIARYSSTDDSTPPTTALPITGSTTTIIPTNSSNTFGISAETATGTNAKLRLSKSNSTQDDILLVGAGGLTIARTDDSTITFTGGGGSGVAQIQSDWTQSSITALDYIKNKPTLATVATSGSYADLTSKPTIPAAQVNSDWSAVSGLAQILNKPTLFSGSYTDLTNKPTIPAAYSLPTATNSSLGGVIVGTGLSIDGSGVVTATGGATTSATFTAVVGVDRTIDTFDTATSNYKTVEYTLYISNNTKIQSQKVLLMQDGTNVYTQEYAIMSNSAGTIASVIATMSAGVVTIKLSPSSGISGSTTYKFTREVVI